MIPRDYITEWRTWAPWVQDFQVEQDLIVSRALVEMFSHPVLADRLAFRGGTALYKLHLESAERGGGVHGRPTVVEYEPDSDLRGTEQVPMQEEGGIETFLRREVMPCAGDAWYRSDTVKAGYEFSFNRYFYMPRPMRLLAETRADILALERETDGLVHEIVGEPARPTMHRVGPEGG